LGATNLHKTLLTYEKLLSKPRSIRAYFKTFPKYWIKQDRCVAINPIMNDNESRPLMKEQREGGFKEGRV
jgi:hypothetical protein